MHAEINTKTLATAMMAVGRIVEHRNTMHVLGCALITVDNGRIGVETTNLDITAAATVAVEGFDYAPGSFCVDAKRLTDIAKKASGSTIHMDASDSTVTVKSGRSRFTLPVMPAGDFPVMGDFTPDVEFSADLSALMAHVAFAVSTEETRYYLNGVCLAPEGDDLRVVATDGHRLALWDEPGASPGDFAPVIIPRHAIAALPKGTANVAISSNKIRVETPELVVVSKLIDGTFPDYKRVIQRKNSKTLTVNKTVLSDAVSRIMTISDKSSNAITLSIDEKVINCSSRSGDARADEDISGDYDGEKMTISFNGKYVLEELAAITTDTVTFRMDTPMSPVLVTGQNGLEMVLMPMRV